MGPLCFSSPPSDVSISIYSWFIYISQLHRLEWYWNMKHSSLNLDSHYNIFRRKYSCSVLSWFTCSSCIAIVESNMHDHFDRDGWLLLPHPDVLDLFRSTVETIGHQTFAIRKSFPNFDKVCRLLIMTRL